MTNEEWLSHFEEAYKLPFRDDITSENWGKRDYSEIEKEFLITEYSKEFADKHIEHILEVVQIFIRYFFIKSLEGYIFCSLDKVKLEFGKTLEENYGTSNGLFYNLAKTYWTFRIQLDEDCKYLQKGKTPLFIMILREVETNIAGTFFPTNGHVNETQQRQVLKEFAPEIKFEEFLNDNPMLRTKKSGCFGILLIFPLVTITLFSLIYWYIL